MSTLVGHILKLQIKSKVETDIAHFYDELYLIDKYILEMSDEGNVNVNFTETELELVNENHSFLLTKGATGVYITYRELDSDVKHHEKLKFITSISINKLDTLVAKGTRDGNDFIYRIPVKTAFQIFFNDEYKEKDWYKEVVTYVF